MLLKRVIENRRNVSFLWIDKKGATKLQSNHTSTLIWLRHTTTATFDTVPISYNRTLTCQCPAPRGIILSHSIAPSCTIQIRGTACRCEPFNIIMVTSSCYQYLRDGHRSGKTREVNILISTSFGIYLLPDIYFSMCYNIEY